MVHLTSSIWDISQFVDICGGSQPSVRLQIMGWVSSTLDWNNASVSVSQVRWWYYQMSTQELPHQSSRRTYHNIYATGICNQVYWYFKSMTNLNHLTSQLYTAINEFRSMRQGKLRQKPAVSNNFLLRLLHVAKLLLVVDPVWELVSCVLRMVPNRCGLSYHGRWKECKGTCTYKDLSKLVVL